VARDQAHLLQEQRVSGVMCEHRLSPGALDDVRALVQHGSRLRVLPGADRDEDDAPLAFTAVVPDADGVVRSSWPAELTARDRRWEALKQYTPGQVVTGVVTAITLWGNTLVDFGDDVTGEIRAIDLSWRQVRQVQDVVTVGQEITTQVLQVDLVGEELWLSMKALQPDPLRQWAQHVGEVVVGQVTKVTPIGVLVRVEDRPDGLEGLVPTAERIRDHPERGRGVLAEGHPLRVRIVDVDPVKRRILLSQRQVHDHAEP
jgi:small subunit ribosomal protein S1